MIRTTIITSVLGLIAYTFSGMQSDTQTYSPFPVPPAEELVQESEELVQESDKLGAFGNQIQNQLRQLQTSISSLSREQGQLAASLESRPIGMHEDDVARFVSTQLESERQHLTSIIEESKAELETLATAGSVGNLEDEEVIKSILDRLNRLEIRVDQCCGVQPVTTSVQVPTTTTRYAPVVSSQVVNVPQSYVVQSTPVQSCGKVQAPVMTTEVCAPVVQQPVVSAPVVAAPSTKTVKVVEPRTRRTRTFVQVPESTLSYTPAVSTQQCVATDQYGNCIQAANQTMYGTTQKSTSIQRPTLLGRLRSRR